MDYIGFFVKKFESGSRGCRSLNQSGSDWGLSCGSYQLILRYGNCINFLKKYFTAQAQSLYFVATKDIVSSVWPGKEFCSSPTEVKEVWLTCLDNVGEEIFFSYEHEHMLNTYYKVFKSKIQSFGDPDEMSRAFQECFWSWAIHKGNGGAYKQFIEVVNTLNITALNEVDDETLFDAIYDKRYEINKFKRYEKGLSTSISERELLRGLLNTPALITNPTVVEEEPIKIETAELTIVVTLATNNPCYKKNETIIPKGGMLHSVGCPQPDPEVFISNWKKDTATTLVHAIVGKEPIAYLILPLDKKAWHCGAGTIGSGNNYLISLEMTEPATIAYLSGANWIEIGDGSITKAHVLKTYENAVNFFAWLAEGLNFDPLDYTLMISHSEGNKLGIASAHADVEHLWNSFGLTMNSFRNDVKNRMAGVKIKIGTSAAESDTSTQVIKKTTGTLNIVYDGFDGINCRTAPSFNSSVLKTIYKNAKIDIVGISQDEKWYLSSEGYYITTLPKYVSFIETTETNKVLYRVRKTWEEKETQIGAFYNYENAIILAKQNIGYKVFSSVGEQLYPSTLNVQLPCKIKNPDILLIYKGNGTTYPYWQDKNVDRHCTPGTYTITRIEDGKGASRWGLLSWYSSHEIEGWIALDNCSFIETT